MDDESKDSLVSYLKDAEVKVVWREEERTKVGRGKIVKDDKNFVVLTVIVSKKDIIAIKQ